MSQENTPMNSHFSSLLPPVPEAIAQRAPALKLIAFDVDGILTDGRLYLSDSGEEMKAFNALDGHGIRMLQNSGVAVAIITGRRSKLVQLRAENLNITHLYQGVANKAEAFADLQAATGLTPAQMAFMGDDVIDLPVLRHVGLAVSVPSAPMIVKAYAHYLTQAKAGKGAVREVCDFIMQAQGTFDAQMAPYFADA